MNPSEYKIGTASMMREMDRKAIEEYGVPGIVLMENAGRGAFEFIMEEFSPRRAAVLAGKGNNGGDGYVIARHLLNAGVEVTTLVLARKAEIKGDAKTNLEALIKMGGPVFELSDSALLDDNRHVFERADLIVDAILGTGIDKEVKGFYRIMIEFVNDLSSRKPEVNVFAVDMPSGMNADTGQIMGAAIRADAAATFGMLKTGQLCYPGASLSGSLAVIDISIPAFLYDDVPYSLITSEIAAPDFPCREEDSHKGSVGHGLVLAGSPGKAGAAAMTGESALRTGCGLCTVACPRGVHAALEAATLEVMTQPLPDEEGTFSGASVEAALEALEGKSAAALGPGIGRGPRVTDFARAVIARCEVPLVIDADGLNAVAEDPSMLEAAKAPVILTPHPGEMARLTGVTTAEVQADRFGAALSFAGKSGAIVVLKGARTIVALPGGGAMVNLTGNPGMATGGTGDALTGVILGLLCQGLGPDKAAAVGVHLHGLAGDLAAEEMGEEGMIAGDVIKKIPAAIKTLRNKC